MNRVEGNIKAIDLGVGNSNYKLTLDDGSVVTPADLNEGEQLSALNAIRAQIGLPPVAKNSQVTVTQENTNE